MDVYAGKSDRWEIREKLSIGAFCLLISILLVAPSLSEAAFGSLEDPPENDAKKDLPYDRFAIKPGCFLTDIVSELRADSKTVGAGTVLSLEDSLGLDDSLQVFRIDAFYRLGRRHRLYFTYFDLSRDARRVLDTEIRMEAVVFPMNAEVQSEFELETFKGAYSFSFYQTEHFDVSASLGAYVADVRVAAKAQDVGSVHESLTMPCPVFGLRGHFALTSKLFLVQGFDVFWITLGNYWGRIIDWTIALEYNFFRHLGLGIGYNEIRVSIDADEDEFLDGEFLGKLKYDVGGILAYVKLYF